MYSRVGAFLGGGVYNHRGEAQPAAFESSRLKSTLSLKKNIISWSTQASLKTQGGVRPVSRQNFIHK